MRISSASAFRIAAVLGFLGVALGAFGAHGLEHILAQRPKAHGWWEKAVLYQFVHVVVMLVVTRMEPFRVAAWWLFATGILLFSGSLYVLALTGILGLGAVTPLGGVCLLGGWLVLAFGRRTEPDRP